MCVLDSGACILIASPCDLSIFSTSCSSFAVRGGVRRALYEAGVKLQKSDLKVAINAGVLFALDLEAEVDVRVATAGLYGWSKHIDTCMNLLPPLHACDILCTHTHSSSDAAQHPVAFQPRYRW